MFDRVFAKGFINSIVLDLLQNLAIFAKNGQFLSQQLLLNPSLPLGGQFGRAWKI